MRFAATTLALSLCWAACSVAAPDQPLLIEAGKSVSLRVGESAQTRDGEWRIGFEGVSADSRCPEGVQCVWAGDATVRVWLQRRAGPRELHELHTAARAASGASAPGSDGRRLRLMRLDPSPVASKPVAPGDYVVTLTLNADR